MLPHWLSWFVLSKTPEERLNTFVFPLVFLLAKRKRLSLAPLYLGSLFDRLDEFIGNILKFVDRYNFIPHEI